MYRMIYDNYHEKSVIKTFDTLFEVISYLKNEIKCDFKMIYFHDEDNAYFNLNIEENKDGFYYIE